MTPINAIDMREGSEVLVRQLLKTEFVFQARGKIQSNKLWQAQR
jgi:hypothetical protein